MRLRLIVAVGILCAIPLVASAHPLGNFTINHHVGLHLSPGNLDVRYVVDMAEIPAFQEIQKIDTDMSGQAEDEELGAYAPAACGRLEEGLVVTLDGTPLILAAGDSAAVTSPGQSGVPILRVECSYTSPVDAGELVVVNSNYEERIGWREMVATSEGVGIITDLSAESLSNVLTNYPDDMLATTPDVRVGSVTVGLGSVAARVSVPSSIERLGESIRLDEPGVGAGLVAIAAAFALGAGHALAPGHGKTIVAAYLVGTRGTARQAFILATSTAVSHTIGVAVLGVIAASAATSFEPTVVYPYLSTLAGLVVVGIGLRLMWMVNKRRRRRDHGHSHNHEHDHAHDTTGKVLGWKSVAALGLSGGLVPSASAVVLLLGAVHLGRGWFGVLLVACFGAGMALALVGSGLLAVTAHRLGWRYLGRREGRVRVGMWIPGVAATGVLILGAVMTVSSLGGSPWFG